MPEPDRRRNVAAFPPRRAHTGDIGYAVETGRGERWTGGSGAPAFVIRVADRSTWQRLIASDSYEVALAFVRGSFNVEGDLLEAVRWWYGRAHSRSLAASLRLTRLGLETWSQTKWRARHNIEFHYDRSNEFYRQFLDRQMVYSCAYFPDAAMSIDDAQAEKLRYVARKLDLQPDDTFLDVGCGWGALVIEAAQIGSTAVGCTLSHEQFEFARDAVRARGLSDRARIELRDYRNLDGRFDKIASVGMYEHVGRHRLDEYFRTLAALLAPRGLLLNSGIARPETTRDDGATKFLRRFVFPGGEVPYLSDVIRAAERAGLEALDIENLRPHYAVTCARWVQRLQAHREACISSVDDRTYRTWLLYLAGSAISFERGDSGLYHILLANRGAAQVRRLTRRYMYATDTGQIVNRRPA